jgi:NAD(P)-dependent dehydrogenase (short-subunit alcohol dehydrogenase family)
MKSVVITGASSGIGRACALTLDRKGFRVFAGVRKEADGAALQGEAAGPLTPVYIDVTTRIRSPRWPNRSLPPSGAPAWRGW